MKRFIPFSIAFILCWLAPIFALTALGASVPSLYISEQFGSTLVTGLIAYALAVLFSKKGKPTSARLFFLILFFIQLAMFAKNFGAIQ